MTDTERWAALLAAYETQLDLQAAYLETATAGTGGDPVPTPPSAFAAPHDVPDPPPELRARLEALRDRTTELERRTVETLARLAPHRRRNVTPAAEPRPSLLDRTL